MTEVKILYNKINVEEVFDPAKPPNVRSLNLEVTTTDDLSKISEKIEPSTQLNEIRLYFWDRAKDKTCNELLDKDNASFALSWEKEKVNLVVDGEEEFHEENGSRLKIEFRNAMSHEDYAMLEIILNPQTAEMIKIIPSSNANEKENGFPIKLAIGVGNRSSSFVISGPSLLEVFTEK